MTPLREGRLHRLDESTEALYLFGVADRADADRTPGWYLRRRMAGEAATIEAGPFASLEEASRHHLGPPQWTHGVRQTPEEILAEATLLVQRYREYASSPLGKEEKQYQFAMTPPCGDGGYRVLTPRRQVGVADEGWIVMGPATDVLVVRPLNLVWAASSATAIRIDDYVKLEAGEGMVLGPHVHIASFCHLGIGGGTTILEEGASCGSGAKIISGSNTYGADHGCSAIAPDATVTRSFAWVKKNATLYAGAIILPGVVIGENAVVAAGAVVRANTIIPPRTLWAGNPATLKKTIQ